MRIFSLFSILALVLSLLPIVSARENVNYDFMIGTGFLEEHGPVVSMASNGDTIEFKGGGSFSTKPKMVNGNGTFIHRNSEGEIIGTGVWSAIKLISFKSYGSGALQGLPENFEGGRALIKVYLDPDLRIPGFDGTLRIDCTLGDVPKGAMEGIRLAVRGVPINFNKEVSGATLFIRKD